LVVAINRLIDKYGVDVKLKTRSESVDSDGRVTYSYSNTLDCKAIIYPISGATEIWLVAGYRQSADYILSFKETVPVSVGDVVEYDNEEIEITEKVIQKLGSTTYYIEATGRRVK